MSENEKKFRCPTQAPMEAYSFEWTVEDFRRICSVKTRGKESLYSENITTGEYSLEAEWCVELDFAINDTIGVYLVRNSDKSLHHYVSSDFHIVSSDKKKCCTLIGESELYDFSEGYMGWGRPKFIDRRKLLTEESVLLLPNDTLTLVCEFRVSVIDLSTVSELTRELSEVNNYTTTMSENVKKFRCRTQLLKKASNFEWSIENFRAICSAKTQDGGELLSEPFTTDESSLETKYYIKLEFTNNDTVGTVYLRRFSKKSLHHYVILRFSIVGSNKKKYFTVQKEGCMYENSFTYMRIKNFINREKLFEEEQLLLPNDTLTIVCELQVSVIDASIVSELTQESNTILFSTSDFENPDLLMDDLQHLYTSPMFPDFTLKVGEEELKVHKKVLCKSSSVFRTLLNCDMKRNYTNCLEITDFDPSIVKTMLRYIYCGQVQDLSPELSVQLYSIADKYNLQDLKDICVQYILENINIDNVCDVLTLLELHDEPLLKTVARDFICANAVAIQETEQWLSLSKTMPHLILDMNRLVISQMKNSNMQCGLNNNTIISINSLYYLLVISILYFFILY